ncbi:hypothetical protein AB0L40_16590 [Patulibacter sp. NPDC049589]|uniref:hypothetical protein n=1 Tax=Patulibacter sp. NPDC049589 TaxID=3154731 RepID=UPI00342B9039
MHDPASPTARDEIATAAIRLIGDADAGDLLRALTPERLAQASDRSASSVRYHFGGDDSSGSGTYAFQRRDLALAILAVAAAARVAAAEEATAGYHAAALGLRDDVDMQGLYAAIADGLLPFLPGPAGAQAAAQERVHHLGLAICDTDASAARLLREAREQQVATFVPATHAALLATDREMVPGRTVEELGDTVCALLDGHLQRLRYDPGAPSDGVNAAVVSIFATFTRPRGGEGFDPVGAIRGD